METCDIVVVGGCFAGLTFAHHSDPKYRVVVLDKKTQLDAAIESTGLITQATKDLLASFVDIEKFLPNHITTIGVVSPSYEKYFFSHTDTPWIYSTDTPQLVKELSATLPSHVDLRLGAGLLAYTIDNTQEFPVAVSYLQGGEKKWLRARYIVGADGSHSVVAKLNPKLSQNKRFLAGHEKVFYGDITFGEHADNTIYHFWFGEFSLGYGGWLSPTIVNGRKAFRLGLAKLQADVKDLKKIDEFIRVLQTQGIIRIDGDESKAAVAFGHLIPIGGVLPHIADDRVVLVGDAAGFCGAFAADGIKGAVVSGMVAARLVSAYLDGDNQALSAYRREVDAFGGLMNYYKKQLLYRFLWDRMKSNRSFHLLYDLIARDQDHFLYQFCDSKDKHRSLMWVVLKIKNIPLLCRYALSILADLF